MSNAAVSLHVDPLALPWTDVVADERRFRRIAGLVLSVTLLAALIVPYLKVSVPLPRPAEDVTPRFARLLDEQRPVPLPPLPVGEAAVPEPAPMPVPEDAVPEAVPPSVPESVPEAAEPSAPVQAVEEAPPAAPAAPSAARARAARSGLLALSQEIATLRTDSQAQDLVSQEIRTGTQPPPSAAVPARDIITSQAGKGSGGIDVAAPAAAGGETRLAGRETTRVTAPAVSTATGSGGAGPRGPVLPARSSEEIQRVFDQQRAALNTLYNRALRNNPTLAGTVVLKLVILPSGEVADCSIVSSELGDADLERRLVARVRQFDFGARRDVAVTTITYPIDFFPG